MTDGRGQTAEGERLMAEGDRQTTDGRGQTAEGERLMADGGRQTTDDRRRRTGADFKMLASVNRMKTSMETRK